MNANCNVEGKRSGINYAQFSSHNTYLSNEFGRDFAMRTFNMTLEDLQKLVGVKTRGKRKGMLRGYIFWKKCIKGGWVKTGKYDFDTMQAHGHVQMPGMVAVCLTDDKFTFLHGNEEALL